MGKITGFMEYERVEEGYLPVAERLKNYKEFVIGVDDAQAKVQAARCMDCGTPFCNNGCPVNNIIPDFNDLVYHQDWQNAITVLHSTNNFPEFTGRICPAPCEAACVLNVNDDAVGIKSIEHAIIDRAWEEGWVEPVVPGPARGQSVGIIGAGPAGSACARVLAQAGKHHLAGAVGHADPGGLARFGAHRQGDAVALERVDRQLQAQGAAQRHTVGAQGQHKVVGLHRPLGRVGGQHAAAGQLQPGHGAAVAAFRSSLGQGLIQGLAHLEAIRGAFAGGVDRAGHGVLIVGQCGLQGHAFRGRDQALGGAAQAALQLDLLRRPLEPGLGGVEHQLARCAVIAVGPQIAQHLLEALAAARGQAQQGGGAALRARAVAGGHEAQAPGPLVQIGLQAELQR